MKEPLKVSPLLKYDEPAYPAHDGEDPLNPRKTQMSKTAYYMAALWGTVGLFSFTSDSDQRSNENPIKFSELGFPHTYASYGTGLPGRLDREKAMEIIDAVFENNDILLSKNIPFSDDGNKFVTSGYSKTSKIGYVWLDGKNTSENCYNSWRSKYYGVDMLPEDLKIFEQLRSNDAFDYKEVNKFLESLSEKNGYYKLLDLKNHIWNNNEIETEIDHYIEAHPEKKGVDYGKEIIERYEKTVVSLDEMENIVKTEDYGIAAFSVYHNSSAYYGGKKSTGYKDAVQKLETLVQDYIDWAKSEGRF